MKKQLLLSAVALFSVVESLHKKQLHKNGNCVGRYKYIKERMRTVSFIFRIKMMVLSMYGLKTEKNLH